MAVPKMMGPSALTRGIHFNLLRQGSEWRLQEY